MQKLYENFDIFHFQKKKSFLGNYAWNYGKLIFDIDLETLNSITVITLFLIL